MLCNFFTSVTLQWFILGNDRLVDRFGCRGRLCSSLCLSRRHFGRVVICSFLEGDTADCQRKQYFWSFCPPFMIDPPVDFNGLCIVNLWLTPVFDSLPVADEIGSCKRRVFGLVYLLAWHFINLIYGLFIPPGSVERKSKKYPRNLNRVVNSTLFYSSLSPTRLYF
jgi:hypothetical protein